MTIAITCSCSARLEVDERFAGKTITCPDCQKVLEVPVSQGGAVRTSGLALASLVLALVGAFTVFGTVLAIICGVLGLLAIHRQPKRLAGKNIAVAGLVVGAVLTGLSVFAYSSTELFGLDGVLRESQWVGKLEYPADLEIKPAGQDYAIKRPSAQWGVFIDQGSSRTSSSAGKDLLLVLPSRAAYIICMAEKVDSTWSFDQCQDQGILVFCQLEISKFSLHRNPNLQVNLERGNKKLWNKEENGKITRFMEMTVHKTFHGQKRTFLLRVIKKEEDNRFLGKSNLFVVAAGAPAAQFATMKKDLQDALDNFRILN